MLFKADLGGTVQNQNHSFCSKILLFGEYSIIKNSMALAIPYPLFEGALRFSNKSQRRIDPELNAFAHHLKKLNSQGKIKFNLDIDAFSFDISEGLLFDSTIPLGHGGGSSGALCAAVYDRYGERAIIGKNRNIQELKNIFALLESHFHGSSSGMDPLVSYLNSGLLLINKEEIGPVIIPEYKKGQGGIFLLNTGRARRTGPLVELFLEKCKQNDFAIACEEKLTSYTNNCIKHFLEQEVAELYKSFYHLSQFQFEYFKPMIPGLYEDLWEEGLREQQYYLKLCGAGGGGWILGMTHDLAATSEILVNQQIRPVFRFDI